MRLGSVLLTAALLTGSTTATATAAPAIDWQPCRDGTTVECATVTVPIDYARPEAGTIDVAIARSEATGRRQGTLFFMPGGPGDSGVDRLLRGNVVPDAVAERFDVVSFDPRGTNRSHPIMCDANLVAAMPNAVPEAGAHLADIQEYARDLGASCREHTGPLIDHVDTVSVARDIDTIRAALGERQLTLYGRSYGTLAGQMYAENFPRRVRGLVLDSVFDHGLPVSTFLTTQVATAEDSFTEFAKWCAADASCALHGQDVGQVYGELWDKAVAGELSLSPMNLSMDIVNRFYTPDWPGTANRLRELSGGVAATRAATTVPFPIPAFCGDQRVRFSSEREWLSLWHKQSAAGPTIRTHNAWLALSMCSAWPAATPNPQHVTDIDRGVPPVLILNSLHDPATSYEWAKDVHRQIDRSVLLTYDGWGHGVTTRTDCTKAVFTDYVVHGRTPRPGTHCAA
ncbi:alpha/beta hydrolase [Actinophytocola oryzae]|uniref:Alpha/beta hydrolase family protein n=1 Tax=Actinophytocola oryzae TaxID=502181 RepID=A0A4R7UX36_9PSEU|nr:alpha/beta hydrolase [Actinophytocola oryzae]TDV40647.1 alpha/beta hydrolase family protein [Actinophytocola oryzae]